MEVVVVTGLVARTGVDDEDEDENEDETDGDDFAVDGEEF